MAPKEKKRKKHLDKRSKSPSKHGSSLNNDIEDVSATSYNHRLSTNKKHIMKKEQKSNSLMLKLKRYIKMIFSRQMFFDLIFSPQYFCIAACAFLILEAITNVFIIENVEYTEIDWQAYMQEVEGFLNGTWDYTRLKGDTGPLVYPAGFVYIFSFLYYITNKGKNIYLAQYIFAGIYLLSLALIFRLYHLSKKLPPYILVFICCMSYRVHSIYVLRLFNDPVAMVIFYGALNCFISGWWTTGSLLYSVAVSVKMNILLFSPALLMCYLYCLGFAGTALQLSLCLILQVVLGLPFLLENAFGYLQQAFNLGRIFLFQWTVNWRFLPEEIFVHPGFHLGLLVAHISIVVLFAYTHWSRYLKNYSKLQAFKLDLSCQLLLLPLFISNFIGVSFSRSLHYQFYVWYFHSIPYLLWSTNLSISWRLLILGVIELCWNIYPSTWWSSILLHLCHAAILLALFVNRPTQERVQSMKKKFSKAE